MRSRETRRPRPGLLSPLMALLAILAPVDLLVGDGGLRVMRVEAQRTAPPNRFAVATGDSAFIRPADREWPPGAAFFASLLVPGAGQALLGDGRWVVYGALETWSWLRYFDHHGHGGDVANRYRDLAWSVARRVSTGPRRDGQFEYYEAMTKFAASGAYDLSPERPGVQPETDTETFNGTQWALARSIFLPGGSADEDSPAYAQALAYYRERAIPPDLAWSWGDNGLEQQVFADLISESDEAYRTARTMLGIVLANHLFSAVDALITARLRMGGDDALRFRLHGGVDPADGSFLIGASVPLNRR